MKAKTILITAAAAAAALTLGWLVTGHSDTPPAAVVAAAEPGTVITAPSGFTGAPPADVTWQLVNTIAVPISPTAGPAKVSAEGIRSGFTHDPAGALMAAANYATADAQRLTAPGPDTLALIDQRMLPWPGQAQDKIQAEAEAARATGPSAMVLQIAGYRWISYDGDHATLIIAERITNPGKLSSFNPWIQLVWTDNDWWVVPGIDGHGEISTPGTNTLSAVFTAWAGVA